MSKTELLSQAQSAIQAETPRRLPKRLPPSGLHISVQPTDFRSSIALLDEKSSAIDSSSQGSGFSSPPSKFSVARNRKRLSLTVPSVIPDVIPIQHPAPILSESTRQRRRPSIISLPCPNTSSLLLRKGEDESPSAPYADGPVEILPKIWLGSADNAQNWNGLIARGIKSILNVAKEINTSFDMSTSEQPLQNLGSTYHPAHDPSGRPAMHYLKLSWSHGQSDLVQNGFITAMNFVDEALSRGGGVLIHCQCGISRSATVAIALVMRATAQKQLLENTENKTTSVSKGMQSAYNYVKNKSKWVSPNMSLIYQLLEYERFLIGKNHTSSSSETSSLASEDWEEKEWGRQRQLLDDFSTKTDGMQDTSHLSEARALDMAMEHRLIARREKRLTVTSTGSESSSNWHSQYRSRRRADSMTSDLTNSVISEDLDAELESVTAEDSTYVSSLNSETGDGPSKNMINVDASITEKAPLPFTPMTARPRLPNGDPSGSTTYSPLLLRHSLDENRRKDESEPLPVNKAGSKRRPPRLALSAQSSLLSSSSSSSNSNLTTTLKDKTRLFSRKKPVMASSIATPTSQTLFIFPPSPISSHTPSTATIRSNFGAACSTPKLYIPKISSLKSHSRQRSSIEINMPHTPTTAISHVDASGWIAKR